MNDTMNNKKQQRWFIGGIMVLIVVSVVFLGRIEFHNELEQEVISHVLIGYIDEEWHYGTVTVQAKDWPQWAQAYECTAEQSVTFEYDIYGGRIGIFADVMYYENRYERRTWFSGRVVERASEYYYKPTGALYLDTVYELHREPELSLEQLKPQQYDFSAFTGKR